MNHRFTLLALLLLAIVSSFFLASAAFVPSRAPAALQVLDPEPPIIDNFNRADEYPLSDNGKWSLLGGYPLKVTSNQLASSDSTAVFWRNDVRYGLDQDVMVTLSAKPGDGGYNGDWMRLYARLQMPNVWDGYGLRLYNDTSGTDSLYLERFTGGTATAIASIYNEVFPGDKLRLRTVGSTIEGWIYHSGTWTELMSVSDSTYVGVGYVAVGIRGTTARLDDFAAASLREPIPDTTAPVDNFNRNDEYPLSDNGKWSLLNGYPLRVISNRLASSDSTAQFWRNDVRYGPDQEAWVTIETKPDSGAYNGDFVRLYVRLQLPTMWEGYALRYYNNVTGVDQVFLERYTAGVPTVIASIDQEILMGDKLKIRAVGSEIQAWRRDNNTGNWSELVEAADSTYVGVGYVAIGVRGTTARVDDFGAATLREAIADTSIPIDNFNRADEYPPSDNGKWTLLDGYPLRVVSNQLASSDSSVYWRNDTSYGPDQEAWATVEAKPGSSGYNGDWMRLYVRLQPATFSGYALSYANNTTGVDQVFLMRVTGGGVTTLKTIDQEILVGDKLRIRATGSTIEAWRRDNNSGQWVKLADASDTTYGGGGYLGIGIRGNIGRMDDFGGGNATTSLDPDYILSRYAPELRYDILDTFRADSASMMTNNDPPVVGETNVLFVYGLEEPLASSEWLGTTDQMTLDYLGLSYPEGGHSQGRSATADDYIDAEDSHSDDAARMQVAPGKMYGRAVPEAGGGWTLQYWFFYYFNWHPEITSIGDHEGDWEMAQVELDSFGVPTGATCSQHTGGEHCSWPAVEKTGSGHPVVYVARGSHASYFRDGTKPGSEVGNGVGDYVGGNDTPVTPAIEEINPPAPGWLDWPGRWGDSLTGDFKSPLSPPYQGEKWQFPESWAENQGECWEVSSSRRIATDVDAEPLSAPPPAPKVSATRVGQRVRIAYSFPSWPKGADRRPVMLLAVVKSSEARYAPLMRRHRISTRKGTVSQPLGIGKGPYKVYAAAYSRTGRSSATVMARVKAG